MKKYLIISIILCISCSTHNSQNTAQEKFIDFKNANTKVIKKDNEITKDKEFALKVPNSLLSHESKVSYYFLQDLKFLNDQRIITLYVPEKKYVLNKSSNFYSKPDFIAELEQLNILSLIEGVELMKNRNFNIKLLDKNFFVMYLNVQKDNTENFNYAINSLNLN